MITDTRHARCCGCGAEGGNDRSGGGGRDYSMMSVGEHRSAVRQTVPSARLHSSLDVPIYIYLFELCYLFYIILC